MLADLGRPSLDQTIIVGFVGDGVHVLVRRALTATDPLREPPDEATHASALAMMRNHYASQLLVETRLYPGVAETLEHFHKKPMAVVTSKELGFTETILRHFEIARFFRCIIGGDSLPERKPHPGPVLEAAARLAVAPGNAVMVGDSENDILAGRSAGCVTCGAGYGFRGTELLTRAGPDLMVNGILELADKFV
jgi:phosphoglycolate phosphatase